MAQASLNFGGYPSYPQVDAWGADAERLLLDRPDLTLVRCRQLVELLTRAADGASPHRDLCDRIDQLEKKRLFKPRICRGLHRVRMSANEAVHVSGLAVPGPGAWEKPAREALRICADAWALFAGGEHGELILPDPGSAAGRARDEAHAKLDRAVEAVDGARDFDAAQRLLGSVSEGALRAAGLPPLELDLIELRVRSIQMSIDNHRGKTSEPPDGELCERMLAWGDARALDEVVHVYNRHAVALLNELRLEEALELVSELEEWRAAPGEFLPGRFSALEIRDWHRGALLGTRGQVLAFLAHAERDPARLGEAIECFDQASRCFVEPEDLERQVTYRLHALVEYARLGIDLDEERLAALEDAAAQIPRLPEEWSASAFRAGVGMKAALVLGQRPPWLGRLVQELAWISDDEPLQHPYEQIVGGLVLMEKNPPKRLLRALKATASKDDLLGWIAGCYLSAAQGTPESTPPDALRGWWNKYGISERSGGAVPAVLPFNYA